jgi:tetratricopeptide (TPR) repeat protein
LLAAGLVVLATVAAFGNSLAGPFVFDDKAAILENRTIRQLWPIWKALCPPGRATVTGRPLLNLSLAVNYAASGFEVWSYHATNLTIHVLAALLLFALVRRTLLLPALRARWATAATPLALSVALLWAVHPLQTESVTYVVQRAESLVGLFYLLTLYCFVRGTDSPRGAWWFAAAVVACLLGMASKEVMVTAPLMLLLYDRTFLAGSFREACRRRWGLYLALAATWLLPAWLVISTGNFALNLGGADEAAATITPWAYFRAQFGAIAHYLRLSLWPHPLVLDYGTDAPRSTLEIAPYTVVVALLGVATAAALWRWPKAGFLGAWFFAILAPTSSVYPLAGQTISEHRMYLPLAAVIAALAVGGFLVARRLVDGGKMSLFTCRLLGSCLVICAVAGLGTLTSQRNRDYQSELDLWQDTVAKAPRNARAHQYLGDILVACGRTGEALVHYRKALKIDPACAEAHTNFANALADCGQSDEAIAHYQQALAIKPALAEGHYNFGNLLAGRGQLDEAAAHYRKALEIKPELAEAHNNLAGVLVGQGRLEEAIAHYEDALELNPGYADAHYSLGNVLFRRGEVEEAILQFQKALEIKPDFVKARRNLEFARRKQAD